MFTADSLYVLIFGSGLLGGFGHCIGMCGPVVATYSMSLKHRGIGPHLLYTLGRITTYGILGGFTGLTGSFVRVIKPVETLQHIALGLAGAFMIIMALSLGGWLPSPGTRGRGPVGRGDRKSVLPLISRFSTFIAGARSTGAYFPMGLLLGFIPCGLLYTALISAAGAGADAASFAGGFLRGMLMLILFGLGTTPAMFLLGGIISRKGEWLRKKFYRGSAVLMIAIGLIFLYRATQ